MNDAEQTICHKKRMYAHLDSRLRAQANGAFWIGHMHWVNDVNQTREKLQQRLTRECNRLRGM